MPPDQGAVPVMEVGYDPELDEAIRRGDHDDPAQAAARRVDWQEFITAPDYRYGVILSHLGSGNTMRDAARDISLNYSSAIALRNKMATELREYLGETAVADAVREPAWKIDLRAHRETAACHAERTHSR